MKKGLQQILNVILRKRTQRRLLAAALAVCMVVTMMPMRAYAVEPIQGIQEMPGTGGLCEHHTEHTLECGYTEDTEGSPCLHLAEEEHTEDCYQSVKDCVHEHTAACYGADAELASDSDAGEPVNCTHECSTDSGCIMTELHCPHESGNHDADCGYAAGEARTPCTYVCQLCNPVEDQKPEEKPVCDCTDLCSEDAGNKACLVCMEHVEECKGTAKTYECSLCKDERMKEHQDGICPVEPELCRLENCAHVDEEGKALCAWGAWSLLFGGFRAAPLNAEDVITIKLRVCTRPGNEWIPGTEWLEGSGSSLKDAIVKLVPKNNPNTNTLQDLVITAGIVTEEDWKTLVGGNTYTYVLKTLVFDDDVEVAPIPETITNLNLQYLEEITYPQATEISDDAFADNKDTLNCLKKVIMPNVTKIGNYAFYYRTGLTEANFPKATEVGEGAFSNCSGLTKVNMPELTAISKSCFTYCNNLKSVDFPKVLTIGEGAFASFWRDDLEVPYGLENAVFEQATEIGVRAFLGQHDMITAKFPKVTKIGNDAFSYCKKMTDFEAGSVQTIGKDAFKYQTTLTNLKLPAVPPTLADSFYGAGQKFAQLVDTEGKVLTGAALNTAIAAYREDGVTEVNWGGTPGYAWKGCLLPKPETITETTWHIGAESDGKNVTATLLAGTLTISGTGDMKDWTWVDSSYDTPWKEKLAEITAVVIEENVTNIGEGAFDSCNKLASVIIPEGVTAIGADAFLGCSALTSVAIPKGVTSIGGAAFASCAELSTVTMNFSDSEEKNIGEEAFYGISSEAVFWVVAEPTNFKGWSSAAESGGTAAEFTDKTNSSTTLTKVPSGSTITAEYEVPVAEAEWTPTGGQTVRGNFADALAAMSTSGGSIKLLTAVSTTSASTTNFSAQDISLDLNGQVWTSGGAITVEPDSTLTLTDGGSGGGIAFSTATNFMVNGTLVLNGGSITTVGSHTISVLDGGTLDLQSGNITANTTGNYYGIHNYGMLKLSGGTIVSKMTTAVRNEESGKIYLSGAPIFSSAGDSGDINCAADDTLIANNGNVESPSYFTGAVSVEIPKSSTVGYVAVSGLENADHAKRFTFETKISGLIYAYDDTNGVRTIKLKAEPVDKGWSIDESGNLTISTTEGMADWQKNGLADNKAALKTAAIAEAVTKISDGAFDGSGLTTVNAPGVTEIENNAFYGCGSLATVNIPKAKIIGAFAFLSCNNLEKAAFPAVKEIYANAFANCVTLATLQLPAAPPSVVNANAFQKCPDTRALILVDASGTPLTGTALTNAQAAYKAVEDGNTADNLWYGWKMEVRITKYTLTVADGTGDGSYESGATVTVTANAPASGFVFDKWTTADGVTFADATAATTTVTMPAKNVTVTATYKDVPTTAYVLTVSGSYAEPSGTGTYAPGTAVNINAGTRSKYTFTGWTSSDGGTFSDAGSADTVFTMPESNVTITAAWSYNGGGSSGGGSSSGGSGSGSGTTTPPAPPTDNIPGSGQATIPAAVDQNGNANVTVTDKNIADAIADAKKDAPQDQPITVEIKVSTDKDASQITATLPQSVRDTLISNQVGSVTIGNKDVSMKFSQAALGQMNAQAQGNLIITAAKADTGKLTGDAQAWIGNRPAYNFTATCDGKVITNLGANAVTITIPYILREGETAENVQAVRVEANGVATAVPGSGYDVTKQAVVFATGEVCATYGIGYRQAADSAAGSATGSATHTVQRGETLAAIARRYQTTVKEIADLNGISNPDRIEVGQEIKIPQK